MPQDRHIKEGTQAIRIKVPTYHRLKRHANSARQNLQAFEDTLLDLWEGASPVSRATAMLKSKKRRPTQ